MRGNGVRKRRSNGGCRENVGGGKGVSHPWAKNRSAVAARINATPLFGQRRRGAGWEKQRQGSGSQDGKGGERKKSEGERGVVAPVYKGMCVRGVIHGPDPVNGQTPIVRGTTLRQWLHGAPSYETRRSPSPGGGEPQGHSRVRGGGATLRKKKLGCGIRNARGSPEGRARQVLAMYIVISWLGKKTPRWENKSRGGHERRVKERRGR